MAKKKKKKAKGKKRARPTKKITITIEFTRLRGHDGMAIKKDDRNYLVQIHSPNTPFVKYLTFIHEVAGHVGSWIFTPFMDEKREHRFITALEKSVKRHWRKYWEGK